MLRTRIDWKKKKTNPKADCLLSICDALDITPEQLLTGKGIDPEYKDTDMDYEVTRSDIKILKQIHSLGDEQYKRLMTYMKALQKLAHVLLLHYVKNSFTDNHVCSSVMQYPYLSILFPSIRLFYHAAAFLSIGMIILLNFSIFSVLYNSLYNCFILFMRR